MASIHDIKEQERLSLQAALDAQKTQIERNRLGQLRHRRLSLSILRYAASIMQPDTKIRFLDRPLVPVLYSACGFSARSYH